MGQATRGAQHRSTSPSSHNGNGRCRGNSTGIHGLVDNTGARRRPAISNTPIHLVGPHNHQNVSEWSPLATLWEQHRQILAIGSIGCLLAEALKNVTQLTSFHITTKLETGSTDTSISTL
jgi:hypothetical protein